MSRFGRLLAWATHAGLFVVATAVLRASGGRLTTDDLWWHAALGRFYAAARGPWLAADPLLYTAPAAPSPNAWLFDLAIFAVGSGGGFDALRALHVVLVAACLAAAWWWLWRAGGSALAASLFTAAFAILAAYRLVQLRPDLLTILAAFLLYALVIEDRGEPSWRRVLVAALLVGVWANLHAAFVLGPVLLAVALAGLVVALPLQAGAARARDRRRAAAIAAGLALGLVATLANPAGISLWRAFTEMGAERPALELVADEWLPVDPLRLPGTGLPPAPLAWSLFWVLLLLVPVAGVAAVRRLRHGGPDPDARIDPALVALAFAGLVAPLFAVRLLWLPVFSLLLLARVAKPWLAGARTGWRRPLAFALAAAMLAAGLFALGDWRTISGPPRSLRRTLALPYNPSRWFAHSVWLLRDAGLEGNLFNEYSMGGFLGFWLAPRLRGSANGTLNVTPDALQGNLAIRSRRGVRPDETFLELLDRQQVDVFLGIGLPMLNVSQRPMPYTTAHLEGAPGWLLAFRNLDSAVYLRDDPRNRANLAALEAWYAGEGVPFDRSSGFDVARVIREVPGWARAHGIIPTQYDALQAAASGRDPEARGRLASLHAALGLYPEAIRIDAGTLAQDPGAVLPRRRLVWALLRAGRAEEALAAAEGSPETSSADALSRGVFEAARRYPELSDEEAAALVARLPLFWPAEADRVRAGISGPRPRPWPGSAPDPNAPP